MILDKILKIPINSKLEEKIDYKEENTFKNLLEFKTRDYCPYCKNENTFFHREIWIKDFPFYREISYKNFLDYFKEKNEEIIFFYKAKCSLNQKHLIYYTFTINKEGEIFKFSEYPFDLIKRKIPNPNKKILEKLKLNDFMHSSYISAQNKLYLGSFLYIRRVLEGLVKKIALDNKINISNNKMLGEKVELIKKYLPNFIVKNIKNFSFILGDTIHNLTEKEASENYQFILKVINAFIHEIEKKINRDNDKKEIELELQKLKNNK